MRRPFLDRIGLCFVGCGDYAKTVATAIQPLLSEIDLYFASRDLSKAQLYCKMFHGLGAFGSYYEAVNDVNVHAVYICTPHSLHLEHTALAASNRKHVLVEKPIANTLEDAQQIINIANKEHINLMVAENYRFMPIVRKCKELVSEGLIGQVRVIQVQEESSYRPSGWRNDPSVNGQGMFIDAGIHKIHFVRYLLGNPDQIYSVKHERQIPGQLEDGMTLITRWSNGPIGIIHHSWCPSNRLARHWVSVSGSKGKIYFNVGKAILEYEIGDLYWRLAIPEPLDGILPMIREFLSSIRDCRSPEVTGLEAFTDLQYVQQAYHLLNN